MPIILVTFAYFLGFAGFLSFVNFLLSYYYDNNENYYIFIVSAVIMFSIGIGLILSFKDNIIKLSPSTNLISIVVIWFFMPIVLMIPIYKILDISMISSYFEAVSMLTTTGYTSIEQGTSLSKSLILWYSTLQWYGGFLTIFFAVSVINFYQHINLNSAPNNHVSDVKNIKLYHIIKTISYTYLSLTLICIIVLLALGMSFYESVIITLSTISTGGFLPNTLLISDNLILTVLSVFMIFGMINLYYIKELKLSDFLNILIHKYVLFMYALFIIINVLDNQYYISIIDKIARNLFLYISIITTTGFEMKNINNNIPTIVIITLVFIGGFYGSTSGGIKIDRLIEMMKIASRELSLLIRPNLVFSEKHERDNKIASLYWAYFFTYILAFVIIALVLSINEITFEQSLIVAAATITNSGNIILNNLDSNLLISFDDKYKLFLSFSMILGRLEILALIGCIMSINRK